MLANCGWLYLEMGRFAEAESTLKRSLKIAEAGLGDDHRETAGIVHNLAMLYHATRRFQDAEQFFGRSVKILEACGSDLELAAVLTNQADLYCHMDCDQDAARPIGRVSEDHGDQTRPGPPWTFKKSLENLARLHWDLDRTAMPSRLLRRAVKIRRNQGRASGTRRT